MLEHKIIINKEFQNDKDKYNILAVAFPELIRYSAFSDLIETASNKLLYINGGKEAADYSIGYFQMKPSFIEQLEVCSKKYNYHTKFKSLLIDFRDIKKVRATRIQRLENIQWQIRYLKAYWSIMDEKYKTKTFLNIEEKIRFYATAYNYGFTKPDDEILAYQQVKAFPLGKNINNNQIAFSDFSIEFINNYSSKLNY